MNDSPIWTPGAAFAERSAMARYVRWLGDRRGLRFADHDALWRWSVSDLEGFWRSIWDYFELHSATPVTRVLAERRMPGARWFEGATLNFASQVFRHAARSTPAIRYAGEAQALAELSWPELQRRVASLAAALRALGVQRGDRVAAVLPNVPETVIAFLACASVGALWSVCAPDMGAVAVLDRLRQITPRVLIATTGYRWGGKVHDRRDVVRELLAGLPTLAHWIEVPGPAPRLDTDTPPRHDWAALTADDVPLAIDDVPFDHPLWVVYSSGTTGAPKPIVHGHGGVVIEHLKLLGLHVDVQPGDVYHWTSSSGWIMWNLQAGGLLLGATIALYDGSPGWPDLGRLWRFVDETEATVFGAGAAFFAACQKAGIVPSALADLSRLKGLGSTGSPLAPETYGWMQQAVRPDLWIAPIAGGTDFASAFLAGHPGLPVHAGEMQCRALGAAVHAFDEQGHEVIDEVGELVCTEPLPSMPLGFWGDADGSRLHGAYFDTWPGVWRHGDWVRITPRGGGIIYGRSDTTINRQGVRMGTSEFYRVVEELPAVLDSLVVDLEVLGRESWMSLFVVLREGAALDDALRDTIRQRLREALSPRHVPDEIVAVPAVPRTLSGKKMEVPIKKLMLGQPLARVASADAMANPECLAWYEAHAAAHAARRG